MKWVLKSVKKKSKVLQSNLSQKNEALDENLEFKSPKKIQKGKMESLVQLV